MIYLDNAATSFPKPRNVIKATEDCIHKYCANPGRSSHKLAERTAEEIYRTREAISGILSFNTPENICFTANATYALNIAIKSIITSKCHVLISDIEHNSVLRPVHALKENLGVEYSIFSSNGDIEKNIEALIRKDTFAVISTLMSNVTGEEIPLSILSKIAKKHNLKLIVDASQIIGHKDINLSENHCDALCAPGHKGLFGIQGCGFAVFYKDIPEKSVIEGGSGHDSKNLYMPTSLPERFEAGTLPSPSVISLRAGIDFINSYTLQGIDEKIKELTEIFVNRLCDISDIEIFGCKNGIISFRYKNKNIYDTASKLAKNGICIREGFHCAPLAHKKIGTYDTGLIRISLSVFNKKADADTLYKVLRTS